MKPRTGLAPGCSHGTRRNATLPMLKSTYELRIKPMGRRRDGDSINIASDGSAPPKKNCSFRCVIERSPKFPIWHESTQPIYTNVVKYAVDRKSFAMKRRRRVRSGLERTLAWRWAKHHAEKCTGKYNRKASDVTRRRKSLRANCAQLNPLWRMEHGLGLRPRRYLSCSSEAMGCVNSTYLRMRRMCDRW